MRNRAFVLGGLVWASMLAVPALGAGYVRLLTNAESGGTQTPSIVISSDGYAYSQVQGLSGTSVTKVDLASRTASSFTTSPASMIGTLFDGSLGLISVDTGTRQIYTVNKTTGAGSVYQNAATITAYVVANRASTVTNSNALLTGSTIDPTSGELYFYDGRSTSIGKTAGVNTVVNFVSRETLTGKSVTGLAASANTLYFGDNTAAGRAIYATSNGTTLTPILTAAQITSVTGVSATSFLGSGLYYAPDNRLYFYDNTFNGILSFDPANAASLKVELTSAELLAGPAGSNVVTGFTWYDGRLAWYVNTSTNPRGGLYAIPEPGAMAGLAPVALLLMRRRR